MGPRYANQIVVPEYGYVYRLGVSFTTQAHSYHLHAAKSS